MKQSKIKFVWNDNYNMNCDIKELEKLGFVNTTYNNGSTKWSSQKLC